MKESELYPPLKRFLEAQHYEVKGEVNECDVVAIRGPEAPVVVELKLTINLTVILQAVDRLSLTDHVYIGIPKQCKILGSRKRKQVTKLLKMLGLGLISIDTDDASGHVAVLIDPDDYKPRISKGRRNRLLGEFTKRVGDPNVGGAEKRKGIMTAYRQQAIIIAQYLRAQGPSKVSYIAKSLQEPKTGNILYRDVYGWFERVSRGVYQLSPRGQKEVLLWLDES